MPPRRRKRIDPSHFALPVEQIRAGTYSDAYFNSARAALRAEGRAARPVPAGPLLHEPPPALAAYLGMARRRPE